MGHSLTVATIHLSLLSYLLAVACWVTGRRGTRYHWLWTAGCVLLWAHSFCAFHFYHNWSHAAALEDTARQTEAILDWRFGEGIWFSYALLVVWLIDVILISSPVDFAERRRNYFSSAVHAYAFFILFNGTVVFEEGVVRWAGIVGTIWVARLAWRYRRFAALDAERTGMVDD